MLSESAYCKMRVTGQTKITSSSPVLLDKIILLEALRILDIGTWYKKRDVGSWHRDVMWMVQHKIFCTPGHLLVKGRHQWGLAAAWLGEKPGCGGFMQKTVSPWYWSYSCWLLQAGLSAGTKEPQSSLFEETPCSSKYSLYLITF